MSNGLEVLAIGTEGHVPCDRLPLYWIGGGAPATAPGSTVQTPPATEVHAGKTSTSENVWLSGAPAFRLGPLVIIRLIRTVWPMTRFRLSPLGKPTMSWALQMVCACAGVVIAMVARARHARTSRPSRSRLRFFRFPLC